ncbi:MAG TPA: GNAT family N-acetyltransferase [Methylomirabilota bacterium]|jgi:ribosomal protein S18 acetylase RimI-like enzyme|nr:GNAT family N-acetyltransferase [Methylomirabilota bacterium]
MATPPPPLSFARLEQYSSRQFRAATQIYLQEFPRDSRLSLARIRALLKAGNYQLIVARDDHQVLGFALIWLCRRPAFVHLDYIAVAHELKGKGIGTALYRWLIVHLKDLLPRAQLLTLEVGDDLIAFYRRSQTKLLRDTPYLFPGPLGPVPMHLMVYDALDRSQLDRRTVQGVIRGLYCGLHRRNAQDASLRSCLASVPAQVFLT